MFLLGFLYRVIDSVDITLNAIEIEVFHSDITRCT